MNNQEQEAGDLGTARAWASQLRTMRHAYAPRPPRRYIVDKFIEAGSLNMFYGAPAVMKSMLLADMAAAVVCGQDWLPGTDGENRGYLTEKTAVLWVDVDNGPQRSDERFEAIGRAHKVPEDDDLLYYLTFPDPPFMMSDDDGMVSLIECARDEIKAGLIIIDNLGASTGDVEENSAGMAQLMNHMRIVAVKTGAAIILIHHQRKGGSNGSRAGDALRGHSSIEAALDLAIHVVREPDSADIVIQSTKTRGVDVPRTIARFNYEHKPGTNDLAVAWFDGVAPVAGANPVRETIMAVVNERGEITKGHLIDAVADELKHITPTIGVNRIRNWIGEMVSVTGELVEYKNGPAKLIMTPEYERENYDF
jgi:hypothetical protein